MSTVERRLLAREAAISAAVAATLTALIVWLGPPGVDLAAHAYQRTFLLEHGFALWNNFWYGGRYSFVTYSFLYYPLAAVIGIKVLAVATISAAALAFTLVVWQEWGKAARFSSRTFAVLWTGVALSAAFPFALGAALALLAMSALQQGRTRIFAGLVFLTLLASPLAFLLLALILAGSSLERRPRRATVVVVAAPARWSCCCAGSSRARASSRSPLPTSCRASRSQCWGSWSRRASRVRGGSSACSPCSWRRSWSRSRFRAISVRTSSG